MLNAVNHVMKDFFIFESSKSLEKKLLGEDILKLKYMVSRECKRKTKNNGWLNKYIYSGINIIKYIKEKFIPV